MALIAVLACAQRAAADARYPVRSALLIANGNYSTSDLPRTPAAKDADLLAKELREEGYTVDLQSDLTRATMKGVLDGFVARIKPGSVALLYYNGIGLSVANRTYLVPVDAELWNEDDVRRDGLSLDRLLADVSRAGAHVQVAIVDAARINPYERNFRGHAAGLGGVAAPAGTLVLHAVARNNVLFDKGSEPSLFMTQLVKQMQRADETAEQVLIRARDKVAALSKGAQVPWVQSTLVEPFFLDSRYESGPEPTVRSPAPLIVTPPIVTPKAEAPETPAKPEAPATKSATVVPKEKLLDACAATVTEDDGIATLQTDDTARAGLATKFKLDGFVYAGHFDQAGHLKIAAPLIHATADLEWEGIGGYPCRRSGIIFSNYQSTFMLALVWDAEKSLALHVVEPPGGRIGGSTYYVYPQRPNLDGRTGLGELRTFGEPVQGTTQAQVYVLPASRNPRQGDLYAFVEFASRGLLAKQPFCGSDPKAIAGFTILHLDQGRLDRRNGKFGAVDCGTAWAGDLDTSGYYQRWKWRL